MSLLSSLFGPRLPQFHFVCLFHRIVTITWVRQLDTESRLRCGLPETGDLMEEHRITWPNDYFVQDDIDDPLVMKGFRTAKVGNLVRRSYPANAISLLHQRHLMAIVPDNSPNGFVAGFAEDYLVAARWVATGEGELIAPWGKA